MASIDHHPLLLIVSFMFLITSLSAKSQSRSLPDTLVLPVKKDSNTSLYVTYIQKRTPLRTIPLVVDLNGRFLWESCDKNYTSSTYNAPSCRSTKCSRVGTHYCHTCRTSVRPGCHNNTCGVITKNPLTRVGTIGELAEDTLAIWSSWGSNPGRLAIVRNFLFACSLSLLLGEPLPSYVQGIAGLGHGSIALPSQLTSIFGFTPKFALCLTPSLSKNGAIFFGNGPYYISQPLTFTPLKITPEGEYSIQVTSIRVNAKPIPFNKSATKQGPIGTTIISTTMPYTVMEHSIFTALTELYSQELLKVAQVKPVVSPFGVCWDSTKLSSTRAGPEVPNIDLVLHSPNTVWRIIGAHSIVQARPGISCLGFVDGGLKLRVSIVIGLLQLEDNLVQFDLRRSVFGISSSLLLSRSNCDSFNFTDWD